MVHAGVGVSGSRRDPEAKALPALLASWIPPLTMREEGYVSPSRFCERAACVSHPSGGGLLGRTREQGKGT